MVRPLGWMAVAAALALAPACAKAKKVPPGTLGVGNSLSCDQATFRSIKGEIPRLQLVSTCSRFAGYLVASLSASGNFQYPSAGDAMSEKDMSAGDDSAGSPASYSKTNVQEAGVDEPDIVKTDGNFLYVVSGSKLVILKSWPPTELSTVGTVEIKDWPLGLVLLGEKVAVISQLTASMNDEHFWKNDGDRPFMPTTRLSLVDVHDRAHPAVERTVDLELWYQDARLLEGKLVVVGESSLPMPMMSMEEPDGGIGISLPGSDGGTTTEPVKTASAADDFKEALADAIAGTRFEQWIPSYDDSASPGRRLVVNDFEDLYMPTVVGQAGILSLVTLDLADAGAELAGTAVLSRGGMVYASTKSLYVAYTSGQWLWMGVAAVDDVAVSVGGGGESQTSIQKFTFSSAGLPVYAGAATVPGWVSNPYQMSEHEGFLRVVSSWSGANSLTVLGPKTNGDMETVGAVPSFAENESVMGTRFIGDRAYVSTYTFVWNYDPFFTFDLADPRAPKLVGALEMPGYSAYLQPLDDQYVLALGMFAASMGDPVTAVQVQVFDVSDFANPVTHAQYVIESGAGGRSFSEALSSYHAFTWYPEEKIFAFPVSVWDGGWSSAFNGLMAFKVDTAGGITKLGQINHRTFDPDGSDWYSTDVRRSVFMTGGDGATYAYTISNMGVLVHGAADFSKQLGRELLPFNEMYYGGMPGGVKAMSR